MMPLPTEPERGQDEVPDVGTALRAVLILLADVHQRFSHPTEPHDDADLALRLAAMHSALRRLVRHLERGGGL